MSEFLLHPRLAQDCMTIADLPLSRVLLMNDAQYPWVILVPKKADITETYQLSDEDQQQLWQEINQVGKALMREFAGHKFNIAALGNMVPQLHVHLVVRFKGDAAWPGPIWAAAPAVPYDADALAACMARIKKVVEVVQSDFDV